MGLLLLGLGVFICRVGQGVDNNACVLLLFHVEVWSRAVERLATRLATSVSEPEGFTASLGKKTLARPRVICFDTTNFR